MWPWKKAKRKPADRKNPSGKGPEDTDWWAMIIDGWSSDSSDSGDNGSSD